MTVDTESPGQKLERRVHGLSELFQNIMMDDALSSQSSKIPENSAGNSRAGEEFIQSNVEVMGYWTWQTRIVRGEVMKYCSHQ